MLREYHTDNLGSANITDIYFPLKIFMAGELYVGEYKCSYQTTENGFML